MRIGGIKSNLHRNITAGVICNRGGANGALRIYRVQRNFNVATPSERLARRAQPA